MAVTDVFLAKAFLAQTTAVPAPRPRAQFTDPISAI